jgi:hypothetical protein
MERSEAKLIPMNTVTMSTRTWATLMPSPKCNDEEINKWARHIERVLKKMDREDHDYMWLARKDLDRDKLPNLYVGSINFRERRNSIRMEANAQFLYDSLLITLSQMKFFDMGFRMVCKQAYQVRYNGSESIRCISHKHSTTHEIPYTVYKLVVLLSNEYLWTRLDTQELWDMVCDDYSEINKEYKERV